MLSLEYGEEESAPRRLLGRASLAGIGVACQQGVSFVTGLIAARMLGAAGYGIINLARNLIDTALIFTRLGLDLGLQRFFGEAGAATTLAARVQVLRQVRLLAALAALLPLIAVALGLGQALETHVYQHAGFARILLCLALALPFTTDIAVLAGAYRGVLRLAPAVLAENILLPVARLLCIVLLIAAGWRLWAVAVGTTLGAVLASGWLALRARRDFVAPAAPHSWTEARRVIRYSGVLAAAVLVTTLTSSMDLLTLGHFASAEDLGQYALAKQLLVLITFASVAFNQSVGGLVAHRYFRGDRAGMLRVLSHTFRWIALGTLPVFAVFLLWGAQLTPLFGASFAISQPVVAWLAAGQFVLALFGPMGWALSMTGRHLLELGILVSGLLLAMLLCLLAVPAWGQLGAAIATFTAITLTNLLRVLCVRRAMGAWPFEARLLLIVAAGLGLALCARLLVGQLPLSPLWRAALGSACFLLCYGAVCWHQLRGASARMENHALVEQG